jgi:outer membrane protein assembly factor BamB
MFNKKYANQDHINNGMPMFKTNFIGADAESNEKLLKDNASASRTADDRSFTMQVIILLLIILGIGIAIAALVLGLSNSSKISDLNGGSNDPNLPSHENDANSWLFGRHDLRASNSKENIDVDIDCGNVDELEIQCALPHTSVGVSSDITADNLRLYYPSWDQKLTVVNIEDCTTVCQVDLTAATGSSTPVDSRTGPALGKLPNGEEIMIILDQGATINGTRSVNAHAFTRSTCSPLWTTPLMLNSVHIGTAPGIIHGNHFYFGLSSLEVNLAAFAPNFTCCSDTGMYGSIDIRDGSIEWIMPTITPMRVAQGYSGAGVWFQPALDLETDTLIVTSGNTYSRPASVDICLGGADPYACLESGVDTDAVIAVNRWTGVKKWVAHLQGIDSWNVDCLDIPLGPNITKPRNGNGNCPWVKALPDYDVLGAQIVDLDDDGKKGVFAVQKSGVAWMLDFNTGDKIWNTLPGGDVGSTLAPWGCAVDYDNEQIICPFSNYLHRTYIDLDDNKRCDGFWASMDLQTGEVKHLRPVPGSRIGDECVDTLRDFEIDHIQIDNDVSDPMDSPIPAATFFIPYNNRTLTLAHGRVIYANGVVYAGSTNGIMYFMDHDDLSIKHEFPTESTIYGGASVVSPNRVAFGTGYARIDDRFNSTTGAMVLLKLP